LPVTALGLLFFVPLPDRFDTFPVCNLQHFHRSGISASQVLFLERFVRHMLSSTREFEFFAQLNQDGSARVPQVQERLIRNPDRMILAEYRMQSLRCITTLLMVLEACE
jgi:hypothetical protein